MLNKFSFKTQITWLSTSLILLTIFILTVNYWLKTAEYVDSQIKRQMLFAKNVLEQNLLQQKQVLTTSASVLAADFGFKQAVATRDDNTIESVLDNHGKRIRADLMMLVDLNGQLITTNAVKQYLPEELTASVNQLPLGNIHAQIINIKNDVYQVIVVPVKAPRTIAYAIIGFQFNKNSLLQLKELVLLDISLVRAGNVVQSSFASSMYQHLPLQKNAIQTPSLLFSSSDYFHEIIPFGSSAEINAILSASLIDIHNDFQQLVYATLLGALVVLLIAISFSRWLSKGITSPLQTLMALTQKIGRGDLTIPPIKNDLPREFNELYSGFSVMGRAIEHREKEIKYQAERDLLTGLFNRHKFLLEISGYLHNQINIALININIKGFKGLNDTIGVVNGDNILVETAERLTGFCQQCKTKQQILTSRINADEFLVAIPIHTLDELNAFLSLLQAELERPYWLEGINLTLPLYYGVANSIDHGLDAEKLIRRAAMASGKALTEQTTIAYYQQGEDEAYLYRLHLIEELKQALDSSHSPLFLNYQPKLNLATGQVDKLEALIRWVNKQGEFVNPELFVGLAEKSGLIVTLTQWVIRHVVAQVAAWNEQGYHFNVSINLSAQDIQHEQFVSFLLDNIDNYQVPPEQIILELTERDLADNEQLVAARLSHLKSLGFEISVDDYGIGQSSLAKLKHLPVDELKIDKCFILTLDQSQQDQDIVASTVSLGHKLGLRVVAEGVENEASLTLLRDFQCDYIQGYYLARPLKAEQLIQWYKDYAPID